MNILNFFVDMNECSEEMIIVCMTWMAVLYHADLVNNTLAEASEQVTSIFKSLTFSCVDKTREKAVCIHRRQADSVYKTGLITVQKRLLESSRHHHPCHHHHQVCFCAQVYFVRDFAEWGTPHFWEFCGTTLPYPSTEIQAVRSQHKTCGAQMAAERNWFCWQVETVVLAWRHVKYCVPKVIRSSLLWGLMTRVSIVWGKHKRWN